ncbi:MAG TPA: alpha/beta hydrolase [Euzebya sp.]|nr:alpha/beta hydrolase [Euzebya sp.]
MSLFSRVLTATGGMLAGAAAVVALSGRSRPAIDGLSRLDLPPGLPPARVVPLPGRGEMFLRDQNGPAPGAPTVVLLHGWVVTADLNWFTTFAALAPHARVLAPDHRGHGRSSRPSTPFRLVDVADDIAALLRQERIGPVILVGYSMGGPVAHLLWQRHPDLVAGMVLCATASHYRFGLLSGGHWRLMGVYQVASRLLPRTWMERVLLAQMRGRAPVRLVRSIGPETAGMARLLPWLVGEIERGDVEDIAEAGRQLGGFDSRGWLRGLDVPSAVVVTTRDRLVPVSNQLELAQLLPDALLLEVDADHGAPADHPEAFNEALLQAIAHVRASL